MKKTTIKITIVILCALLLPYVMTILMTGTVKKSSISNSDVIIYYNKQGNSIPLTLEDYIMGAVAATLPLDYSLEACKSQAVIVRTYVYLILDGRTNQSGKASCTVEEVGLPFISMEDLKLQQGESSFKVIQSMLENAVITTSGKVLTYENKLITPLFCATTDGVTRSADAAFNSFVPYLVSVESRRDVESPDYMKITSNEVGEILKLLKESFPNIEIKEADFFDSIEITDRDEFGYVKQVVLGDKTIKGDELAVSLGLSSSNFTIQKDNGKVKIICKGKGHGLGLSQFGANCLALEGKTYEQILTYYYTGVQITDR